MIFKLYISGHAAMEILNLRLVMDTTPSFDYFPTIAWSVVFYS